jgi:hypothetical protein
MKPSGGIPLVPGGGEVTPYGPASYLKRFIAAQASVISLIVSDMLYLVFGNFMLYR